MPHPSYVVTSHSNLTPEEGQGYPFWLDGLQSLLLPVNVSQDVPQSGYCCIAAIGQAEWLGNCDGSSPVKAEVDGLESFRQGGAGCFHLASQVLAAAGNPTPQGLQSLPSAVQHN